MRIITQGSMIYSQIMNHLLRCIIYPEIMTQGKSSIYQTDNYAYLRNRLGDSSSFSSQADKRYLTHFAHSRWGNSGLNYHISIANHTLVFIDAPGLVEEDRERERYGHRYGSTGWTPVPGGAIDFVKKFAAGPWCWDYYWLDVAHADARVVQASTIQQC